MRGVNPKPMVKKYCHLKDHMVKNQTSGKANPKSRFDSGCALFWGTPPPRKKGGFLFGYPYLGTPQWHAIHPHLRGEKFRSCVGENFAGASDESEIRPTANANERRIDQGWKCLDHLHGNPFAFVQFV